jgi:asparagine synthase (glutamine-hydrolysing)
MPLVDVALVTRATAVPASSRSAVAKPKRILRSATEALVPSELRGGPKRGFPVPVDRLLLDEGRTFVERLLLSDRSLERGVFRPDGLRAALTGENRETAPAAVLFVLASFELWARVNVDRVTTEPQSLEAVLDDHEAHAVPAAAAG